MKPRKLSYMEYISIVQSLREKGWLACGAFGSMKFTKGGKTYDLSAADLNQLDRIEKEGLFLVDSK